MASWRALVTEIESCTTCERLVAWRHEAAQHPPRRHADDHYWERPVAGFGDRNARIVFVGLAPGAHGANRTGRVFTGDRSGDFLFGALHRAGLANQPTSLHREDGLALTDAYVTVAVRCAPPDNRPTPQERDCCAPYFVTELTLLRQAVVYVALGGFAYEALWRALSSQFDRPLRRPKFAHGLEVSTPVGTVLGAFHPSQQNTFTGRLTPAMFDAVVARAVAIANA